MLNQNTPNPALYTDEYLIFQDQLTGEYKGIKFEDSFKAMLKNGFPGQSFSQLATTTNVVTGKPALSVRDNFTTDAAGNQLENVLDLEFLNILTGITRFNIDTATDEVVLVYVDETGQGNEGRIPCSAIRGTLTLDYATTAEAIAGTDTVKVINSKTLQDAIGDNNLQLNVILANKEDKANKATSLVPANDTLYPTTKAVADAIAAIPVPTPTTIIDNLNSAIATSALSANQGKILRDYDIASGALVGNNIVLTTVAGAVINIDATAMLADVRVSSGVYNAATKSLDFTMSNATTVSVPVSALLPVTHDNTLSGDGSTTPLKVELSADANNILVLGTDGKLYATVAVSTHAIVAGTATTSSKIRLTDNGQNSDINVDDLFSVPTTKNATGKIILPVALDFATAGDTNVGTNTTKIINTEELKHQIQTNQYKRGNASFAVQSGNAIDTNGGVMTDTWIATLDYPITQLEDKEEFVLSFDTDSYNIEDQVNFSGDFPQYLDVGTGSIEIKVEAKGAVRFRGLANQDIRRESVHTVVYNKPLNVFQLVDPAIKDFQTSTIILQPSLGLKTISQNDYTTGLVRMPISEMLTFQTPAQKLGLASEIDYLATPSNIHRKTTLNTVKALLAAPDDVIDVTGVTLPIAYPVTTLPGTPVFSPAGAPVTTAFYKMPDGTYSIYNGTQFISSPAPVSVVQNNLTASTTKAPSVDAVNTALATKATPADITAAIVPVTAALATKQDKTSVATHSLIAGSLTASQKIRLNDQTLDSDINVDDLFSLPTTKNSAGKIVLGKSLLALSTVQPTPTPTGNTTNLNTVFKDASGDTWIVDGTGIAVKAGATGATEFVLTGTSTDALGDKVSNITRTGFIGAGGKTPTSSITGSSLAMNIVNTNTPYSTTPTDHTVRVSSGVTGGITLHPSVNTRGQIMVLINDNAVPCPVLGQQLITHGASPVVVTSIPANTSYTIQELNGNWITIDSDQPQKNLTVINTAQPTPTATGNTTNLNSTFKDVLGDTWIVDNAGVAIKAAGSALDFFRSGTGTTLPDGTTDTTENVSRIGKTGFGLIDPTALTSTVDIVGTLDTRPISVASVPVLVPNSGTSYNTFDIPNAIVDANSNIQVTGVAVDTVLNIGQPSTLNATTNALYVGRYLRVHNADSSTARLLFREIEILPGQFLDLQHNGRYWEVETNYLENWEGFEFVGTQVSIPAFSSGTTTYVDVPSASFVAPTPGDYWVKYTLYAANSAIMPTKAGNDVKFVTDNIAGTFVPIVGSVSEIGNATGATIDPYTKYFRVRTIRTNQVVKMQLNSIVGTTITYQSATQLSTIDFKRFTTPVISSATALKKFRVVLNLVTGANLITDNLGLIAPFSRNVEVRLDSTGELIACRVTLETNNTVTITTTAPVTGARITIIG
jgi:hypothetical protein